MDEYTLYLDESYTHSNGGNCAFAIGGIIINNSAINDIDCKLNNIKNEIWSDITNNSSIILHEKDLKEAIDHRVHNNKLKPEYKRFRRNSDKVKLLYKRMSELIKNANINTIGCVVLEDIYNTNFPKTIGNEISLVCMQIILENYTHFLFRKGAVGKIIYESRDTQDKTMLMRFYQVSSIGTMYVQPLAIQQKILQFSFVSKKENVSGLQIADFIPSQIARKKSGKNIRPDLIDLTNNIFLKSYDGENRNSSRYGIKVVPRVV
jgi:hypothetical protein